MQALIQEIDLSALVQKSCSIRNYAIASFHDIDIPYHTAKPKWFSIRKLATMLGYKNKPNNKQFANHHDYESIFDEIQLHEHLEEYIRKDEIASEYLFSTKLLWLAIHWLKRELFIEKMCSIYANINIYEKALEVTKTGFIKPGVSKCTLMDLDTAEDDADGYVYLPGLQRSLQYRIHLERKQLQAYTKCSPNVTKRLNYFKERCLFDGPLIETRAKYQQAATFIHPNLAIYYLDAFKTIPFWNYFIEYYSHPKNENDELASTQIDLNNTKVEDINENFAYGMIDDLKVKFHKNTSFIHARSTAELIAPQKTDHTNRWFSASDTIEYINELNKRIHDSVIARFDEAEGGRTVLGSTPEPAIEEQTLTKSALNLDSIRAQLDEHPAWFILRNGVSDDDFGYYFHPDLFINFVIWLDKKRAASYMHLIAILCQRAALDGTTVKTITIEEFNRLMRRVEELERRNAELEIRAINAEKERDELRREFDIQVIAETGSIVIDEITKDGVTSIHARTSVINEPSHARRHVIESIRNPKRVLDGIQDTLSSKFTRIQKNRFEGELNDEAVQFIEQTINDFQSKTNDEFEFNEALYEERKQRYQQAENNSFAGFLYECICSKELKANLYRDISDNWLQTFGLSRSDPGIDLVDVENKRIYQCKYYSNLKPSLSLQRSFAASQKVKAIDAEYQLILIVPTSCYVNRAVRALFDNIVREELVI